MQSERIESYLSFMDYLEYPMVLVEKDSGIVLKLNYEAQKILGKDVARITISQDTSHIEEVFAEQLENKKSLLWYRIMINADEKKYFVSGIVNDFYEEDKEYCALMFEPRGELQRGSVTLERIINRSGYVAIYAYADGEQWRLRYVSQNMKQYGYTSEQFYRGMIGISDLMSPEDYERMVNELRKKASAGEDEYSLHTYWIGEDQQKHFVRMDMHFNRNRYGKVNGLDFLVHDLNREQKESEENQYLKSAIHKSKSVVLVKRYQGGKRHLRFITPNAVMLGWNVEALLQGNRLTEDYIHPEDREEVLDGIYRAIASSASGYVQSYRVVGDDGARRYVRSEITISHLSDTEADVEFLITDITEEKEYEQQLIRQQRSHEQEMDFIMKGYERSDESFDVAAVLKDEFLDELVEAFASVTGLYSVLIDTDGKFITKPLGPVEHLGEFYDMFERPFYKELYQRFTDTVLTHREPVVMEMDDGNPDSRISGAPIMMDDKHVATWILCAYSKTERNRLMDMYRAHWSLSERVSNYLYNETVVAKEIQRCRLNELRLEKHIKQQEIITDLLSNLQGSTIHTVDSILERVGRYLDVERVVCYGLDEQSHTFTVRQAWDVQGLDEKYKTPITWRENENLDTVRILRNQDYLVISDRQCYLDVKKILMEKRIKAMLLVPLCRADKIVGAIICSDYRRHRVWQDSEIQFLRNIRNIVQQILLEPLDGGDLRSMTTSILEAYNYCPEIVYIRDASTGQIYFSNKTADEAFGMALKGYDSNLIAKSLVSRYENNPAMRKHFVYNKNVTKWESYIKQLDKIMSVEEIHIEWYEGREAKLVILKDKNSG